MLNPIVWIHAEALAPTNPALLAHPGAPAVFVFDRELIARQQLSLQRLGFLYECLLELPVTLRHGDVVEELLAFAQRHGADGISTSQAVDPRFSELRERIGAELPLEVLEPEAFVALPASADLRRFSRYWRQAEPVLWARAGAGAPPAPARRWDR
jgi:deoxyribodipyrimidine photo-lyase